MIIGKKNKKTKKSRKQVSDEMLTQSSAQNLMQGAELQTDSNNPTKKKLSEKQKTKRALKRLLRKILVIIAVCVLLLTFVLGVTIYHDNAMFPAVRDGDLVILFKPGSSYNGDIIRYEVGGEKRLGRVVGIPGDTISMNDDGTYSINDTVPYESIYYATHPAAGSDVIFPYTVKEDEYLVFNDMREDTKDSRQFGAIPKSDVKGKVVLTIRRRGF